MNVVYANQRLPSFQDERIIFLVGPTPRQKFVKSWRPDALKTLTEIGFDGLVLVPERNDEERSTTYIDQIEWEQEGLEACSQFGCIAAWVPRELETMPAFTTNVEFGLYVESGHLLYGRPANAPKTRYLDWIYTNRTKRVPHDNLRGLLIESAVMANDP
tara:strand:- start:86 stop:562 length:477 start_codon:yes stop_codon:yes gene_type:complete